MRQLLVTFLPAKRCRRSDGTREHQPPRHDPCHATPRCRCRSDPPDPDGALDRGEHGAGHAGASGCADRLHRDGLLPNAARVAVKEGASTSPPPGPSAPTGGVEESPQRNYAQRVRVLAAPGVAYADEI